MKFKKNVVVGVLTLLAVFPVISQATVGTVYTENFNFYTVGDDLTSHGWSKSGTASALVSGMVIDQGNSARVVNSSGVATVYTRTISPNWPIGANETAILTFAFKAANPLVNSYFNITGDGAVDGGASESNYRFTWNHIGTAYAPNGRLRFNDMSVRGEGNLYGSLSDTLHHGYIKMLITNSSINVYYRKSGTSYWREIPWTAGTSNQGMTSLKSLYFSVQSHASGNEMLFDSISLTVVSGLFVSMPTFTPDGEALVMPGSVTVNCATTDATIRYTTNGTDPTETSTLYTGPISVNQPLTLKARAWKNGYNPSDIKAATYTTATMIRRAVLNDPRLDISAQVTNMERLVPWLIANGFADLDSDALASQMDTWISAGQASGSVVVLTNGICPTTLMDDSSTNPRWLRYLTAGGRIVYVGSIPFYSIQTPDCSPMPYSLQENRGLPLIGISSNDSTYWEGSRPMTFTQDAVLWEFQSHGSSIRGQAASSVTTAFDTYTTTGGLQGAGNWLKRINDSYPWSGLIRLFYTVDFSNDLAMSDVWRAAHYAGVGTVPALPSMPAQITPTTPEVTITCTAGGMSGRLEFVRGESVTVDVTVQGSLGADTVRLDLKWNDDVIYTDTQSVGSDFTFGTDSYAYGPYQLVATALDGQTAKGTATVDIGVRYVRPEGFQFGILMAKSSNPVRENLMYGSIFDAGMEACINDPTPDEVNACIGQNLGFILRAMPNLGTSGYNRLNRDGIAYIYPYTGLPTLSLFQSSVRDSARTSIQTKVAAVADLPAFRPYVLCNDDFSVYYGYDYASAVTSAFTSQYGQTAPTQCPAPSQYGPVLTSDTSAQAYLNWTKFCLTSIDSEFNQAEREGAVTARSDIKIGPVPGHMQLPLVSLWQPGSSTAPTDLQYPTYDFGGSGFNLISSYCYDIFWRPLMVYTYWMEIGRMGNRTLPQFIMPDCIYGTAGYARNSFYHILAGGVRGMNYFSYAGRTLFMWQEILRLGQDVVPRIGPVQKAMVPAQRDIALLDSFTSSCFSDGKQSTHNNIYAYGNLLQAHFDVEVIAESEAAIPGFLDNYSGVIVCNIKWISQAAYDALASYAQSHPNKLILDQSVPFSIPNAVRVNIDIAEGVTRTSYQDSGCHTSTYGIASRIQVVKDALDDYLTPRYNSSDIKLVATRFQIGNVPYTWFINAQDHDEYYNHGFYYFTLSNPPFFPTQQDLQNLANWETTQMASDYTTSVTLNPLPGVPYDLVTGQAVSYTALGGGSYQLNLTMERFGGALVAFYPEAIGSISLAGTTATVLGVSGNPIAGVVPVEFTLTDPNSEVSPVSQVIGAINGVAVLPWTRADNDLQGTWTLTVKELASNKTTSATLNATQSGNIAPATIMTGPLNGTLYSTAPVGSISLTALSWDWDGTISKVEFYNGTNLLHTDINGGDGWAYNWTNVPAGDYSLTVKAYDDDNASTASTPVNIWVSPQAQNALSGYWSLNETTGSYFDTSGHENHGTVSGTLTRGATGRIGNAVELTAAGGYIDCGNGSSLSISDNITIDFWMYPTAWVSGYAANLASKRTTTSDANFMIYWYGDGAGSWNKKMYVCANAGGTWQAVSAIYLVPEINQWYHVIWTYNSTTGSKLYINGVLQGTTVGAGALATSNANLKIGHAVYSGRLDEFRIYNRVLSATEIEDIVGYWDMNEGTSTLAADKSGNLNNGTFTGTLGWSSAGRLGNAVQFATNGGEIDCGNDSSLNISDNITIDLWMYPTAWSTTNLIRKHGSTSDSNFLMYFYGDDVSDYWKRKIYVCANAGGTWQGVSTTYRIPALNQWYHIVWSYNSTTGSELYVNGVLQGTTPGVGALATNNANLKIGKSTFNGRLDEVRIYK